MRLLLGLSLFFAYFNMVQASTNAPVVGEVISIRGNAERMFLVSKPEVNKRETRPLRLFRKVYLGDLILTHQSSKVVVKLHDGSKILLGSNSSVELRSVKVDAARPRELVVYQNWGKIRLKVSKRGQFNETLQLRSKFLTVGMKNGSEILSNIYQVNSQTSNDIMVLKNGARILGSSAKVLTMRAGEFFNNKMLAQKRWWDLPKLSRSLISFLSKSEYFLLPRLRLKDGTLFPLERSVIDLMSKQTISWRQSSIKKD